MRTKQKRGLLLLLIILGFLVHIPMHARNENTLEEVYHTKNTAKKTDKKASIKNLELGSLVLYFSQKPEITQLPTKEEKPGMLVFFCPHVDCNASLLRTAQQQAQGQGYKLAFEKVAAPFGQQGLKKGLKVTMTFDPTRVAVGGASLYERFERTTNTKAGLYNGIIFRFYDNALLAYLQTQEKPIALLAQGKANRIIIDYGHGGKDPGAIGSSGLQEKQVTFLVGEQLAAMLEKKGYEVGLTRRQDETLTLAERASIANSYAADAALLISLHANSSSNPAVAGIESFFTDNTLFLQGGHKAAPQQWIEFVQTVQKDRFNKSKLLAQCVQNNLVADVIAKQRVAISVDRSIKPRALTLLMSALVPAVTVELCFLSNKKEEKLMKTPEYQAAVAKALCNATAAFVQQQSQVV